MVYLHSTRIAYKYKITYNILEYINIVYMFKVLQVHINGGHDYVGILLQMQKKSHNC